MVIVLRSIHRVKKCTHLEREKPLKCLNTFVMIVFVYMLAQRECDLYFCVKRGCLLYFTWCVKRPTTYAWNCFLKRFRGPSTQNDIYLFKISASALFLKIFLKFRKFQPRYSYKIYSNKKKQQCIVQIKKWR